MLRILRHCAVIFQDGGVEIYAWQCLRQKGDCGRAEGTCFPCRLGLSAAVLLLLLFLFTGLSAVSPWERGVRFRPLAATC